MTGNQTHLADCHYLGNSLPENGRNLDRHFLAVLYHLPAGQGAIRVPLVRKSMLMLE